MRVIFYSILCLVIANYVKAQPAVYIQRARAIEDIDQLVKTFEKVHYNPYFKTSKKEFNLFKKHLIGSWSKDSIPLKVFMVTGMKLTAVLSGGHSFMDWQNPAIIPELKSYLYIPFTGKLDAQNNFVVTRSQIPKINRGDQIKSINGISAIDLYKECMSYIGGIEAFKNAYCEKVFPLYMFFNSSIKPPYQIKISKSNEVIYTKGLTTDELISFVNSSQNKEDYTYQMLDDKIGLISYNSCNDYRKFKAFLKETFKRIKQEEIDKLIIDIRENGGGDSELNDLLLSYITKTPYRQSSGRYWKVSEQAKNAYSTNKVYVRIFGSEFMDRYMNTPNQQIIEDLEGKLVYPRSPKNYFNGKTCILIGPNTFSSANFLADAVKTYKISTLIGAPTGEYTNDFGEQLSFTLQNSGSTVYISSTFDIGANGNNSILEPVYPDIAVEKNALEYALHWITRIKTK